MATFADDPQVDSSKADVAKRLADTHRAVEPAISGIFRIEAPGREDDPAEPIKLLEINPNTTVSGIMPVWLSPHAPSGIFFPSIIVEIHPSEWPQLQQGTISLPHGWQLNADDAL
jgi:hypothetical protein